MSTQREMVKAINSGDRESRTKALARVAHHGLKAAGDELLAAVIRATHDPDPVVREWAVVALRTRGHAQEVIEALWRCYREDPHENLRCYTIESLGDLKQALPMITSRSDMSRI
jgi:hypothetical protein